ncbi:hypothetical protein AGMMS49587_07330 [Spirochaetia bacterium]|nr:hypothetical protein AGMMS49587_07330 [Spirochaetia bacterium]
MKKSSVLWLLPLAAALFIGFPSTLFAGGEKDKKKSDAEVMTVPGNIGGDTAASSAIPGGTFAPIPDTTVVTGAAAPIPIAGELVPPKPDNAVVSDPILSTAVSEPPATPGAPPQVPGPKNTWDPAYLPKEIPIWITEPEYEGVEYLFVGVGSAHGATDRLSLQLAEARARQDIALQLSSNVKAMITDFAENQGSGDAEFDLLQASRTQMVGKQLIEMELKDVKVEKRARASDGTWWVKVLYEDPVKKAAYVRANAARIAAERAAAAQAAAAAGASAPVFLPPIEIEPPVPGTDYTERAKEALKVMDQQLEKVNAQRSEKVKVQLPEEARQPSEEAKAQSPEEVTAQAPDDAKDQLSEKSRLKTTAVVLSE